LSQITTGIRSVLSGAWTYDTCQRLMGGRVGRVDFAEHVVKADATSRILDIGCGTAELLAYLPPGIDYLGFDISPEYVAAARRRFTNRASFICGVVAEADVAMLPPFDIVVASAVLHHLDDEAAERLMEVVRFALRGGGRFASIDPVRVAGQNRIARFLIDHDRGLHVREPEGYASLVRPHVDLLRTVLRHRRWIPYTHWMMEGVIDSRDGRDHGDGL
jgi:SAM-dependent methyltransferase